MLRTRLRAAISPTVLSIELCDNAGVDTKTTLPVQNVCTEKKQGYAVSQQSGDPTESNTCQTANKNDHTAAMLVVGFRFSPSGRRNENLSTT